MRPTMKLDHGQPTGQPTYEGLGKSSREDSDLGTAMVVLLTAVVLVLLFLLLSCARWCMDDPNLSFSEVVMLILRPSITMLLDGNRKKLRDTPPDSLLAKECVDAESGATRIVYFVEVPGGHASSTDMSFHATDLPVHTDTHRAGDMPSGGGALESCEGRANLEVTRSRRSGDDVQESTSRGSSDMHFQDVLLARECAMSVESCSSSSESSDDEESGYSTNSDDINVILSQGANTRIKDMMALFDSSSDNSEDEESDCESISEMFRLVQHHATDGKK